MSAAQHTPGPWINRVGPSTDLIIESASNAFLPPMVAKVCGWHDSGHQLEALANARLIAAAPDLLAALEEIASRQISVQGYNSPSALLLRLASVQSLARAAIARATGTEGEGSK